MRDDEFDQLLGLADEGQDPAPGFRRALRAELLDALTNDATAGSLDARNDAQNDARNDPRNDPRDAAQDPRASAPRPDDISDEIDVVLEVPSHESRYRHRWVGAAAAGAILLAIALALVGRSGDDAQVGPSTPTPSTTPADIVAEACAAFVDATPSPADLRLLDEPEARREGLEAWLTEVDRLRDRTGDLITLLARDGLLDTRVALRLALDTDPIETNSASVAGIDRTFRDAIDADPWLAPCRR